MKIVLTLLVVILLLPLSQAVSDCVLTPSFNVYSKNTLRSGEKVKTDYCIDHETVGQYECKDWGIHTSESYCAFGCEDGACKSLTSTSFDYFIKNPHRASHKNSHNYFFTLKLEKGWNLVFRNFDSFLPQSRIKNEEITVSYLYDSVKKDFVEVYPSKEGINSLGIMEFDDGFLYLASSAMWTYSKKSDYVIFSAVDSIPVEMMKLTPGWNMVGIMPSMVSLGGKSIHDFKGNCEIEKAFRWDALNEEWINMKENMLYPKNIGYGLVIKSANDCQLGEEISDIPSMPE